MQLLLYCATSTSLMLEVSHSAQPWNALSGAWQELVRTLMWFLPFVDEGAWPCMVYVECRRLVS